MNSPIVMEANLGLFTKWQNSKRMPEAQKSDNVTSTTFYCLNKSRGQLRIKRQSTRFSMGGAAKNLHPHLMYHIGESIACIDTVVHYMISQTCSLCLKYFTMQNKEINLKWLQCIYPYTGILQRQYNHNALWSPRTIQVLALSESDCPVVFSLLEYNPQTSSNILYDKKQTVFLKKSLLCNRSSWLSGNFSFWHIDCRHLFITTDLHRG